MMSLFSVPIKYFFIVCPLVFLAGLVDSIAGGGGLISLPAYLFTGIPPVNAISTNKLSSCIGTSASTARYLKNGYIDKALAVPSIAAGLIGSFFGAKLLLHVDSSVLKYPMIILLPFIAVIILKDKNLENCASQYISRKKQFAIVTLFSLIIGAYDGFYGPGTGTFLLLVYTKLAKMDIKQASGNTKLVNLTSNLCSLTVFMLNGSAIIPLGLIAGIFCIAGHYMGSGMVMKSGFKAVKPIILIVIALLMIKLIAA